MEQPFIPFYLMNHIIQTSVIFNYVEMSVQKLIDFVNIEKKSEAAKLIF